MFQLAGDSAEKSAAEAQTIMNIETAFAKASLTRVQLRDPQANYHKLSATELKTLTPDWSWDSFFTAVGLVSFDMLHPTASPTTAIAQQIIHVRNMTLSFNRCDVDSERVRIRRDRS